MNNNQDISSETDTNRKKSMEGSESWRFFSNDFVDSSDQKEITFLTPQMILCNKYRLEYKVSSGNLGNVWKAFDLLGERFVALKIVPPDIQQYRNEMLRIKNTFQTVQGLNHEYISPVYALENDNSIGYFLVMKWVDDPVLADFKNEVFGFEMPMDKKLALKILANIANALDYAHRRGVIHRDLKPTNIIIVRNNKGEFLNAALVDLGLAAEIEESSTRLSSLAFGMGASPSFMAPEQWQSKKQDARTDQYALAAIAYELFSGKSPYIGRNIELLRTSVLKDHPEYIRTIPFYTNSALRKGMAKNKEDRFSTCSEFVKALSNPYWQLKNSMLKIYKKPLIPILTILCLLLAAFTFYLNPSGKVSQIKRQTNPVNFQDTEPVNSQSFEFVDTLVVPDDCSSINLALQRINEGGTIQIKPGYYSLSQNLHINRNVKIIGGSPDIFTDVILCWEEQGSIIIKAPNAHIAGISFRVSQKDQCLSFLAGKTTLEHCEIVSMEGSGMIIRGGNTTPTFKNCKIYNCGKEGIRIEDFSKPIIERCTISNNHIGIMVSTQSDPLIIDSEILESMEAGISVSDQAKGTIKNSLITKNGLGIQVSGYANPLFDNNRITENNRDGVRIEKDGSGTFRNNTIQDNGTVSWHLERDAGNVIREKNTPNK